MKASILARGKIETDLRLTLLHHPVGADIQVTRIGIARDDRVARARVTASIQGPVPRDRKLIEINLFSDDGIFVDRGSTPRHLAWRNAPL